jgi:hypothetical protein
LRKYSRRASGRQWIAEFKTDAGLGLDRRRNAARRRDTGDGAHDAKALWRRDVRLNPRY